MSDKINPSLVKSDKIKVTFENALGSKKAVVELEYDKINDAFKVAIIHPTYKQMVKDRHELYMFQALAFHGTFHK